MPEEPIDDLADLLSPLVAVLKVGTRGYLIAVQPTADEDTSTRNT